MTPRERFAATIEHRPVDRVPFDLAGTSLSAAAPSVEASLRSLLGFSGRYESEYQKFDERTLKHFDIDFRRVGGILAPRGEARTVTDGVSSDCWGIRRRFTGQYWDIIDPPLANATIDDLKRYPWPRAEHIDMDLVAGFRREAQRLFNETPYVVVGEHPVYGILELGCWMCGFDDFLLKTAIDPDFVRTFFDIVLAYQKEVIDIYYGAIGKFIHVTTSGDDFGTQTGPFISPEMFAELVAPYYRERIAYTKRCTTAKYFHHTCGAVFPLIPHLIDAGVDILNPIQPGARDMEPEKLKRSFGDTLTFWGGIDTQHVLPEGTPDDVAREVRRILNAMAHNGGYVLAPAHNLQPDVPAANVAAIYTAGQNYFRTQRQ